MPPKPKAKKGETVTNPGKVSMLPRPHAATVEVAHPATLPSFLIASSLFVLASHSKCDLVLQKPKNTKQQQNNAGEDQQQQNRTGSAKASGRGAARATTPKGNNKAKIASTGSPTVTPGNNKKDGHNAIDINNAVPPLPTSLNSNNNNNKGSSWDLQVTKKSIFLCDNLIGELINDTDNNNNANGEDNNINNNGKIDFDKLTSFFAASSAHHGLVVVRDEFNNQRIFTGGMNDEGQLPLPIRIQQQTSSTTIATRSLLLDNNNTRKVPVADTLPVPFKELKNVEFKLLSQQSRENSSRNHQRRGSSTSSNSDTDGEGASSMNNNNTSSILRLSDGAVIVAAACGSAHTVVLVRNPPNHRRRQLLLQQQQQQDQQNQFSFDTWQSAPITYLFGCGRSTAIGEYTLPPSANNNEIISSARNKNNKFTTTTTKKTPLEKFMEENSPRRAVPPSANTFRHLPIGDGEDFDALWAFGDLTFARGRRGLLCFGCINPSSSSSSTNSSNTNQQQQKLKYDSPTQPLVVIPAPLGCLVKEVIVLNEVASQHPRKIYAFLEDNGDNNNDDSHQHQENQQQQQHRKLFDATRLLEIHIAFPAGAGGELKMLHPPPPIFSHADVTDKIFGPVATALRQMGAQLFRIKKLTCGSEHAVAVTVDGAVIGFGSNYFGQLGNTAGGADQGPKFADESSVGPRTARMYPNPDCSAIDSRLKRQYYTSAILLRPPSLKRSPLIIAQAYAQHKGRTVEFNDVVKVVTIPDRLAQQTTTGVVSPSPSSSMTSETPDTHQQHQQQGFDGEEDDDAFVADDDENGKIHSRPTAGSPSASLKRKGTVAPKTLSLAAAGNRGKGAANNNKLGDSSNNYNSLSPAEQERLRQNEEEKKLRALMNPSWPKDTAVDCCCGPLFTAIMQANAELVFMGDQIPSHLQQQQQNTGVSITANSNGQGGKSASDAEMLKELLHRGDFDSNNNNNVDVDDEMSGVELDRIGTPPSPLPARGFVGSSRP